MAGVEQRMKLFLTPYVLLTDPETQRLYPVVNSLLNSRRMAASSPNPMQLAKRGESTYVRGFFLGDTDEHVIVSLDWSAIELVIIGELSKDPEFKVAFGQRPHEDLHTGATASVLQVEMPWITDTHLKALKRFSTREDWRQAMGVDEDDTRLFTNLSGETLKDPSDALKFWRTEIGKGANFNYFYSGWLHTIGQKMSWSMNTTAEATERYRDRFHVAEDWRLGLIDFGKVNGYAELPDGQRRYRYEATYDWMDYFKAKWPSDEILNPIVHEITRRIHKRAHNQLVNSVVQGTCATIMKRSIVRMREATKGMDVRFMVPIHDEMVFSVHRSIVPEFIRICYDIMVDHKDIFPTLMLDASPAVGTTFEPWHPIKAPFGQIELSEPPKQLVGLERAGRPLNDDGIREMVDYLQYGKLKLAA
jgi:DNA polymerase I-like protein with 3'-5' exonuclease and polymerase domains